MNAGRVKWFDCKKGFGFIVSPGLPEVFVHFSVIEPQPGREGKFQRLFDGELVQYDLATGPNGLCATKVRCFHRPKPSD